MSNIDLIEVETVGLDGPSNETAPFSYVDWGAILAGAVVAAAIFTLMSAFGAAIGLSVTSALLGKGLSAGALGLATALWIVWITVSSFVAGGYLAGRLRRKVHDASKHESDVRDGAHGVIVWAIGTLLVAALTAATATGVTKAAAASPYVSGNLNPANVAAEHLLRNAAPGTPATAMARVDAEQILATSAMGGAISPDDKTYLVAQVTTSTGVSVPEATKRVEQAEAQLVTNAEKIRQTAETARKIGVLIAFLTAASLAVSAAAAWWAAGTGGKHRDEGADLSHLTAWR